MYTKKQKQISKEIDSSAIHEENWHDWKWQLKHSIRSLDSFLSLSGIKFSKSKKEKIIETINAFPLSITPYYFSLIDFSDYENDPVFRQSFPSPKELIEEPEDMEDPLFEDGDNPTPLVTHRYPDRVLLHVTNMCSMYCRHCTRKRKVGDHDNLPDKKEILAGIEYIKKTKEIRDVLISGGDPLMFSDEFLEWILAEISKIEHVEVIRIGTRMPVVLPFRITDNLVNIFKKHKNLWINTHFNHPRELTNSSKFALSKLADAGIPLGNQSVLLAGVNDCPRIMKNLVHKLVKNRVRPYYLYQCDLSKGLAHFRTPVGKGIEIMENLIGHTSGFAVPTYVIDAPGGGGKIPVLPTYLISYSTNKVVLRNYEGVISTYKEPDSYQSSFCDRNCEKCDLQLNLEGAVEEKSDGISQLLADSNEDISLVPTTNKRLKRRKKHE